MLLFHLRNTVRKIWPFKARDEWPPGPEPVFVGEAEVLSPLAVTETLSFSPREFIV